MDTLATVLGIYNAFLMFIANVSNPDTFVIIHPAQDVRIIHDLLQCKTNLMLLL